MKHLVILGAGTAGTAVANRMAKRLPSEFLFLADDYFTRRGIRDRVELVYATPLDGAFTRPTCSRLLASLLTEKGITVETEFAAAEVDAEGKVVRSYDDRRIPYDLLVTVPVHKGASFLEESGLGDDMGFVPTDPRTLAAKKDDHVFALGDATDTSTAARWRWTCSTSRGKTSCPGRGRDLGDGLLRQERRRSDHLHLSGGEARGFS